MSGRQNGTFYVTFDESDLSSPCYLRSKISSRRKPVEMFAYSFELQTFRDRLVPSDKSEFVNCLGNFIVWSVSGVSWV